MLLSGRSLEANGNISTTLYSHPIPSHMLHTKLPSWLGWARLGSGWPLANIQKASANTLACYLIDPFKHLRITISTAMVPYLAMQAYLSISIIGLGLVSISYDWTFGPCPLYQGSWFYCLVVIWCTLPLTVTLKVAYTVYGFHLWEGHLHCSLLTLRRLILLYLDRDQRII